MLPGRQLAKGQRSAAYATKQAAPQACFYDSAIIVTESAVTEAGMAWVPEAAGPNQVACHLELQRR